MNSNIIEDKINLRMTPEVIEGHIKSNFYFESTFSYLFKI